MAGELSELSLLPLKPGDHLWRPLPDGGTWHALYVGQFLIIPSEDGNGTDLAVPSCEGASAFPQSVVTILPSGCNEETGAVARIPLEEFVSGGESNSDPVPQVRLYTRRPRERRASVARVLQVIGAQVDATAIRQCPQLLPWWAIFDESAVFQAGLCATRSRGVRYRLLPRGDAPVHASVTSAVLAGGAVVSKGRVVLRGVRLMKALRLTRAAATGWANLGGFVGQTIASSILDDGNTGTSVATSAGGWAGGCAAAAAATSIGMEALGAGSVAGGLVVCGSISALGAVAGAGIACAAKKALETPGTGPDRTAEYHDCTLQLLGNTADVFELFDATLEFPPEDDGRQPVKDGKAANEDESEAVDNSQRVRVAGWYAARVSPQDK